MKSNLFISALFATVFSFAGSNSSNANPKNKTEIEKPVSAATTKIQVALLLDTSSSMEGLIDQAKSRLWNIVNTLTTLKYEGKTPDIEIALYEYGNSGLSEKSNYIRQITPLSTDWLASILKYFPFPRSAPSFQNMFMPSVLLPQKIVFT